MDLDWASVRTTHGPADAAYFNGAVLADRHYSKTPASGFTAVMEELSLAVPKTLAMQITGGSTSIADAYEKMRLAGAAARTVLIVAASQKTGVAVGDLRTENGAVLTPDGTLLAYAELAETAAGIAPLIRRF